MPSKKAQTESSEVAHLEPQFSRDELRGIQSFDDAVRLMQEKYGDEGLVNSSDMGDGFSILPTDEKEKLVGTPIMFLKWEFHESKKFRFIDQETGEMNNAEFVSAYVVTQKGNYIINDGSTGIYRDLKEFTYDNNGRMGGLVAPRGLRVSEYEKTLDNGEIVDARTFYIDTAPLALAG